MEVLSDTECSRKLVITQVYVIVIWKRLQYNFFSVEKTESERGGESKRDEGTLKKILANVQPMIP